MTQLSADEVTSARIDPQLLEAARAEPVSSARMRSLARILAPVFAGVTGVLIWYAFVRIGGIRQYVLPSPTAVGSAILSHQYLLWKNCLITVEEILIGFAAAAVVGLVLGYLLASSRAIRGIVYPYIVVIQVIPKIAFAPLFVIWFGLGVIPNSALVATMAFFPVAINTLVGFQAAGKELDDLARILGLGRTATLLKVLLPQAAPSIFGGFKIGMTQAVVGAVVAEFIAGQGGLGFLVVVEQGNLNTPLLFGSLVYLTLLGIVLFGTISFLEWLALPWNRNKATD